MSMGLLWSFSQCRRAALFLMCAVPCISPILTRRTGLPEVLLKLCLPTGPLHLNLCMSVSALSYFFVWPTPKCPNTRVTSPKSPSLTTQSVAQATPTWSSLSHHSVYFLAEGGVRERVAMVRHMPEYLAWARFCDAITLPCGREVMLRRSDRVFF